MFEAYSIGVTLKLTNLVGPQLALLAKEFERLEGLTVTLNENLRKIGMDKGVFSTLTRGASSTATALDRASRNAGEFERRLAAIKATAGGLGAGNMPGMLPVGGGGRGGGNGGGHGNRNGFHGGNIHFGANGIGLGTAGLAAGDAFIPLAITAGMIYGGHSLYESAKSLDTERQKFRLFGLSAAQNSEAFNFVGGMHVYGSSQAENMRNFREAQGVFRESGLSGSEALAGAKLAAPVLSKLDYLSSALDDESAAKMKTANMAMLRYVELSGGLKSAADFNRIADFGYRLNASSGGTVDWQQLLAFKKTAGTAGYNLSDDAMARLEPLMAEFSGGRAGTSLQTGFNRIAGITRIPNQVAHLLVESGVWDKNRVEFNANGGIKNVHGNPLGEANTKLYGDNPELFYETVIRPVYEKMKLSSTEIMRDNAEIFGRTGGAFFNSIERSMPIIKQAVDAMAQVKGIQESVDQTKSGLSGQEKEFTAAWTDFKTTAGTTFLPFFSGVLKGGTSLLRGLQNPQGDFKKSGEEKLNATNFIRRLFGFDVIPGSDSHGINTVAAANGSNRGVVHTSINIDGKQVASAVTPYMAAPLGSGMFGGGVDSGLALPMPGIR